MHTVKLRIRIIIWLALPETVAPKFIPVQNIKRFRIHIIRRRIIRVEQLRGKRRRTRRTKRKTNNSNSHAEDGGYRLFLSYAFLCSHLSVDRFL